jgi:hypothetical protein
MVNAAPAAVADEGDKELITGAEALIVKLAAEDFVPSGFATTTEAVPAVATSAAAIDAVSCDVLT